MNNFNKKTTIIFCLLGSIFNITNMIMKLLDKYYISVFPNLLLLLAFVLLIIYVAKNSKNKYILTTSIVMLIIKEMLLGEIAFLIIHIFIIIIMFSKPFDQKGMNYLLIIFSIVALLRIFGVLYDALMFFDFTSSVCITIPLVLAFYVKQPKIDQYIYPESLFDPSNETSNKIIINRLAKIELQIANQTQIIRTIKNIMVFFTVINVIGGALIILYGLSILS